LETTVSQSLFVSFRREARNLGSGFLNDIDIPTDIHVRKIALTESGIQVYFRTASRPMMLIYFLC